MQTEIELRRRDRQAALAEAACDDPKTAELVLRSQVPAFAGYQAGLRDAADFLEAQGSPDAASEMRARADAIPVGLRELGGDRLADEVRKFSGELSAFYAECDHA